MTPKPRDIDRKLVSETRVAGFRRVLDGRDGIRDALRELHVLVPDDAVVGSPFCIINFVTSVAEGYDAEVGVPVSRDVDTGPVATRAVPEMEVLSLVHDGSAEATGESYGALFGHASRLGIISDEFCREVYPNWGEGPVELQFVIHRWGELFDRHTSRVLGDEAAARVAAEHGSLSLDAGVEERFRWTKAAVESLAAVATPHQCYDVLSSCAHVFPEAQVAKLRDVYTAAKAETGDGLAAVDAVLDFMDADPGWGKRPRREGRVLYTSKAPRDRAAYEKAETDAARRSAYCFCPLVRDHLDEGMPKTFCNCGAGWFRTQWEGATGKPVTIEILKSVLGGDDECSFAITLSDEL